MSKMKKEIISSTSSCGSLVTGDRRRVGISKVLPKRNSSILALPRHQTLAASNSAATEVIHHMMSEPGA